MLLAANARFEKLLGRSLCQRDGAFLEGCPVNSFPQCVEARHLRLCQALLWTMELAMLDSAAAPGKLFRN